MVVPVIKSLLNELGQSVSTYIQLPPLHLDSMNRLYLPHYYIPGHIIYSVILHDCFYEYNYHKH